MQEALVPAINEFLNSFSQGKSSLPQFILGSNIVKETLEYLCLNNPGEKYTPKATMVLGSVYGDIYFPLRIEILTAFFEAHGIHVIKIGGNLTAEKFIAAAEAEKVQIIGISTYIQTACWKQKAVVDYIKQKGLQDKYITLVGGTGIPAQGFAEKYGADIVTYDAMTGLEETKKVLKKKLNIIL
jgi:methanogenic corrinoid protein MtbC1